MRDCAAFPQLTIFLVIWRKRKGTRGKGRGNSLYNPRVDLQTSLVGLTTLRKKGLWFVRLDVISYYLIEKLMSRVLPVFMN